MGEELVTIVSDFYNITAEGNFEYGTSIMNCIKQDLAQFAARHNVSPAELQKMLSEGRSRLFKVRGQRKRHFEDDKIFTSWNGLMIAALAKAARVGIGIGRIYCESKSRSCLYL